MEDKMVKADDKFCYEGNEPEKFSNFEELQSRVRQLQETLDEHAEILRQNELKKTTVTEAPYVDEDAIFRNLEDNK